MQSSAKAVLHEIVVAQPTRPRHGAIRLGGPEWKRERKEQWEISSEAYLGPAGTQVLWKSSIFECNAVLDIVNGKSAGERMHLVACEVPAAIAQQKVFRAVAYLAVFVVVVIGVAVNGGRCVICVNAVWYVNRRGRTFA